MGYAYLDGIKDKPASSHMKPLLLWVVLVTMFLAIWQFLSPSPPPASRADHRPTPHRIAGDEDDVAEEAPAKSHWETALPLLGMLIGFPLILVFVARKQLRHGEGLRSAEAMLLENDVDGAVAKARTLLKKSAGYARFQALLVLGRCAEQRGDFDEAADIYERASTSIPSTIGSGLLKNQVVPLAFARRAFALAAAGRLDEAESVLAAPQAREALPGTYALVVRARVIVDSKRGRYRQLLDGLTMAHTALREALPLRERILLRTVAAHARHSLADAHRAPQSPPPFVDPELAAWIARVIPGVQSILEGAS